MKKYISAKNCILAILGSAILAFGLYEVHSISVVKEGGILGMTLLLDHFFSISPAVSSMVMSLICYAIAFRMLGSSFLFYSFLSMGGFSFFYAIFERSERLWPFMAYRPWLACVVGAVFVGIGAGLCVKAGGAQSGDDALAMAISEKTGVSITVPYLASDLIVLLLTLTYIPFRQLIYSFVTVILSGQIIGLINMKKKNADKIEA
jgi:uncharacterized membrane-anchored protein YitT (DUF2179 family)